jgi:prepilin-type N-terminal cleavage/methylation domain-containing protein/prepilin-type processing-associated H-X9-DG protein
MKRTPLDNLKKGDQKGFSLIELLVVIVFIGVVAGLLLPQIAGSKARARNAVCVSQLKQLGIAVRLYAEDDNSILPRAETLPSHPLNPQQPLPRICDVLNPYLGKAGQSAGGATVFKCPADNDYFFEVEGSSYQWYAALNGERIDFGENFHFAGGGMSNTGTKWSTNFNITFTSVKTPLLFDYAEFHPRPPNSGKNVVFMDGHVTPFGSP